MSGLCQWVDDVAYTNLLSPSEGSPTSSTHTTSCSFCFSRTISGAHHIHT